MPTFPSVTSSLDRLLRSGWIISEAEVSSGWKVTGSNSGRSIAVLATTRDEALHFLCQHAEAIGLLSTD